LALNYAFFGNFESAQAQMEILLTSEVAESEQWRQLAQDYLNYPQTQEGLLEFCLATKICDQHLSFEAIMELSRGLPNTTLAENLTLLGVEVVASGRYEFIESGQQDDWLLITQFNSDRYDFRLLSDINEIEDLIFVGSLSKFNGGVTIAKRLELDDLSIYQISSGESSLFVGIERVEPTNQIRTRRFSSYDIELFEQPAFKSMDDLADELLSGVPSEELVPQLVERIPVIHDKCVEQDRLAYCYELFFGEYLLGLACEMTGDDARAVEQYLHVWEVYPTSPYAIMAAAKLERVP
jgi:hypothetical protein